MKIILNIIFALALAPITLVAADLPPYDSVVISKKFKGTEDDRKEAIDIVLANTPKADAATLFVASAGAYSLHRLEDSGFLFYAAQMRAVLDMQRFEGGSVAGGPAAAFGAMRYQIGEVINPAIVRDPDVYAAIVKRLENWDMATTSDYSPGWEGSKTISQTKESELIKEIKEGPLKNMRPLAKLLQQKEYFTAFLVYQDFNLAPYKEKQKPERIKQKETAEKTILRIEKQMNMSVLSAVLERKKR